MFLGDVLALRRTPRFFGFRWVPTPMYRFYPNIVTSHALIGTDPEPRKSRLCMSV